MNRTGDEGHDQDRKPSGITHSIHPAVPCPETVLVVVMTDGSYLLVGYPQGGPTAFVVRDDARPLRQVLAGAFGCSTDDPAIGNGRGRENGDGDENRHRDENGKRTSTGTMSKTAAPEHAAAPTKQAQP